MGTLFSLPSIPKTTLIATISRNYDHGKYAYGQDHRAYAGQQALHILGDDLLGHYGANPGNYQQWSNLNYRMSASSVNGRDTRVDNAIISEVFSGTRFDGRGGYDSAALAVGGINRQQQLDRVGARFDAAKTAYQATRSQSPSTTSVSRNQEDGDAQQRASEWRGRARSPARPPPKRRMTVQEELRATLRGRKID